MATKKVSVRVEVAPEICGVPMVVSRGNYGNGWKLELGPLRVNIYLWKDGRWSGGIWAWGIYLCRPHHGIDEATAFAVASKLSRRLAPLLSATRQMLKIGGEL